MIRYLSVCSGIEAASVAWEPLGWRAVAFSEIDKFPSAVLEQRHPNVPNLGDITRFEEWPEHAIDLLVGGTPCQSFSIAGLREGLADPRGSLMLTYLAIARRYQPRWLVWENVPGVLSSNGGRDFGAFLGGLEECGYHAAWRVLDAQYVRVDGFPRALPQRRRRVFVVGYLGDWRRAAAVLFDGTSLRGDSAPRREAGQGAAGILGGCPDGGCVSGTVSSKWAKGSCGPAGDEAYNLVAQTLTADMYRSGGATAGNNPGVRNVLPICFTAQDYGGDAGDTAPTLRAGAHRHSHANNGVMPAVASGLLVRRLTPRECERLQGFPDDYTAISFRGRVAADGPRYRALGNSMAVNVMRWIGRRIDHVEAILQESRAAA